MLQTVISVFASIAGFASFLGFVFLSRYYESFGISFQYFDLNPNHLLFRGIFLIYSDFVIILIMIIIVIFAISTISIKGFCIKNRIISRNSVFIFLAAIAGTAIFFRVEKQASEFADRDMRSDTTALRQLTCVSESQTALLEYLTTSHLSERKVLILVRQNQRIFIFSAPETQLGRREIELLEATLTNDATIGHHSARYSILSPDQLTCNG